MHLHLSESATAASASVECGPTAVDRVRAYRDALPAFVLAFPAELRLGRVAFTVEGVARIGVLLTCRVGLGELPTLRREGLQMVHAPR